MGREERKKHYQKSWAPIKVERFWYRFKKREEKRALPPLERQKEEKRYREKKRQNGKNLKEERM